MAGRSGTITERFWAKVKKTDGCWEWTGAKHKRGYGLIRSKEISMYRAHRLSWVIHNGPIPDGLHVLHDCDNPSCTRPDHLFLGTHKDNMEDATRKGRMKVPGKARYGADNKSSKLDAVKVAEIRKLAKQGMTDTALAAQFQVSRSLIHCVRNNQIWRDHGQR